MFIDLHAHVLPGVDDGPADMEQAVDLCRQAQEDGIDGVCACPHVFRGHYDCTRVEILDALSSLQDALDREGIPLEVKPGMECFLVPDIVERIRTREVLTLAGSRYLAVELPFALLPVYTSEILFRICLTGLVPVLVHPERNMEIATRPDRLRSLVEHGSLVLMNAGSLTGAFGTKIRKAAEEMLRQGLVHGIATDAHNLKTRPALITPAIEVITAIIGKEAAQSLIEDLPRHVWEDREYERPDLPPQKKRRWLW